MSRFIEIDFSQLNLIVSELGATGDRASNIAPVGKTVALVISSYTDEVFNSAPRTGTGGTAANGYAWEKLKESTLRANKGKRRNGQILRDTGALLNSLQSNSSTAFSPRSAANFFGISKDSIEFGTNLPQGSNNNKRPFLAHTEALSELVKAAMINYILTGETL